MMNILLVICGSCLVFAPPVSHPKCLFELCARPACPNPYTRPGQCCPVCSRDAVEPGTCPQPTGAGTCAEECFGDSSCPLNQKCCSNGCGHSCQTPVGAS